MCIRDSRQVERAVLASEIQMLPPFEGYLCLAGHHRARVRIPYLAPVRRQPGFIRRVEAPAMHADAVPERKESIIKVNPNTSNGDSPRPPRLRA